MWGNDQILLKKDVKFLGIRFDARLTFVRPAESLKQRVWATIGTTSGLLKRRDMLSGEVKTTIYKTAIRPILSYGFVAWTAISSHQMETIRQLERQVLRWTREDRGRRIGSFKYVKSSQLYAECSTTRFDCWLYLKYNKFCEKMTTSENPFIKSLFENQPTTEVREGLNIKRPQDLFLKGLEQNLIQNGAFLEYNKRRRDGATIYPTDQ